MAIPHAGWAAARTKRHKETAQLLRAGSSRPATQGGASGGSDVYEGQAGRAFEGTAYALGECIRKYWSAAEWQKMPRSLVRELKGLRLPMYLDVLVPQKRLQKLSNIWCVPNGPPERFLRSMGV